MKRDPRLRPLSRDHQHALALARRATLAAKSGDPSAVRETWDEVLTKFDDELVPHFAIEERLLLPAMRAACDKPLVDRILDDHRAIRKLVRSGDHDLHRLAEFGERLTGHVRFEERVAFPSAETKLPSDVLDAIEKAATLPSDEGPTSRNPRQSSGGGGSTNC